jgi:hypothetical protein
MKKTFLLLTLTSLYSATGFATETPNIPIQATQAAPSTVDTNPSSYPALIAAVGQYVEAWQKQDFKTLRTFENWDEGPEPNEIEYLQKFDADFHLHEWKITKVDPQKDEGVYRVLVLVSHNLPKQIAAIVPNGAEKKVKSTLAQLWKKQGDKFVHLFNIERAQTSQFAAPKPGMEVKPVPNNIHKDSIPATPPK